MTNIDLEKLIDELANRVKSNRDVSKWQISHHFSGLTNLLIKLNNFPRAEIPAPDFAKIKNRVLDRIYVPQEMAEERSGWLFSFSQMAKIAAGAVGTLLIVVSLGIGTAVAALQSTPGQTIYPLKKIVENIELSLTRDPNAKANLQIQFANNRLDELSEVIAQNKAGEISSTEAQKIVAETVSDLQKTTQAALSATSKASGTQPKVSTLNKLVDLSNKQAAILQPLISAASVKDEGQIKILQDALQTSTITKEEAIKNIENAGLVVEDQPITIPATNQITANGKITALTSDTVSIGTAKFLLTTDTKYVNIKSTELKVDTVVDISGEVRSDNKTYALTITAQAVVTPPSTDTQTDTQSNTNTTSTGQ